MSFHASFVQFLNCYFYLVQFHCILLPLCVQVNAALLEIEQQQVGHVLGDRVHSRLVTVPLHSAMSAKKTTLMLDYNLGTFLLLGSIF